MQTPGGSSSLDFHCNFTEDANLMAFLQQLAQAEPDPAAKEAEQAQAFQNLNLGVYPIQSGSFEGGSLNTIFVGHSTDIAPSSSTNNFYSTMASQPLLDDTPEPSAQPFQFYTTSPPEYPPRLPQAFQLPPDQGQSPTCLDQTAIDMTFHAPNHYHVWDHTSFVDVQNNSASIPGTIPYLRNVTVPSCGYIMDMIEVDNNATFSSNSSTASSSPAAGPTTPITIPASSPPAHVLGSASSHGHQEESEAPLFRLRADVPDTEALGEFEFRLTRQQEGSRGRKPPASWVPSSWKGLQQKRHGSHDRGTLWADKLECLWGTCGNRFSRWDFPTDKAYHQAVVDHVQLHMKLMDGADEWSCQWDGCKQAPTSSTSKDPRTRVRHIHTHLAWYVACEKCHHLFRRHDCMHTKTSYACPATQTQYLGCTHQG